MRRFDDHARGRIRAAVEAIERDSAAEVVVRVVPGADRYADVPWRVGAIAALAALVAVLFAELAFAPLAALAVVLAGGLAGHALGARWTGLVRWMTSETRRADAVAAAARQAFVEEAVDATRERTGVLVFVGVLEDRIVVVPDRRLQGLANGAAWGRLDVVGAPGEELLARLDRVLTELGALARTIAPREPDDVNELPDGPRIG